MKSFARATALASGASLVAFVSVGPIGCGDEESTTGRRIALEAKIGASQESKDFTNAMGWNVKVTRAVVATGAFYYYDGGVLFTRKPLFGIKSAFAHPGHYVPGNAKGELLQPTSVDLLAGASLGVGSGVSGFVRSASFGFGTPAQGPFASELSNHVAIVEGTAARGADARTFRVELGKEDVLDTKGRTVIEGCPFAETDMQSDGVVTISVKLTQWFDQVDFQGVPESTDGRAVLLGGSPRNQVARSVKASVGYAFAYAPSPR